jgi:16S rRNA (guanine527-N7)-methyltransferase
MMDFLIEQIKRITGIDLTDAQIQQFQQYEHLLLEWNQRINLTAIRDVPAIRIRHFLDSLTCWLVMKDSPVSKVIDLGTGAGFPGIPLKIAFPDMQMTLVESTGKKARFCQLVVDEIHLERVTVLAARAEEIAHQPVHRECYDWALARAVALMPSLVEYLLPFVRIGGSVLAQKGSAAIRETSDAQKAIRTLGGALAQIKPVQLPDVSEEHNLIWIRKIAETPSNFPRAAGMPLKKPIQ